MFLKELKEEEKSRKSCTLYRTKNYKKLKERGLRSTRSPIKNTEICMKMKVKKKGKGNWLS